MDLEFRLATRKGEEQVLHLFEKPLREGQCSFTVDPQDTNALLDRHLMQYGTPNLLHWRESAVVLANGSPEDSTSYEVQAIRAGKVEGKIPLGVEGIVLTPDGVPFGIRGGDVAAGTLNIAPSGSMAY